MTDDKATDDDASDQRRPGCKAGGNDETAVADELPDPQLLSLLVCPITKTRLTYDRSKSELISKAAALAFPIRNGVPLMIVEAARRLDDD
ncbi:MAG: Trm112 family protein [Alphaproteobacteria bacterium]|nr:Trm112 family protein [Alphaproteobacteria bacterium]